MSRSRLLLLIAGLIGVIALIFFYAGREQSVGPAPQPAVDTLQSEPPQSEPPQPEPPQPEPPGQLSAVEAESQPSPDRQVGTGELPLALPIDCEPGVDCWIANYVDVEPDPEVRDYACGRIAYDGHKGTDFAIRDEAAMRRGVPVLAAAPGVVRATRDGMADANFNEVGRQAISGTECGNGVLIEHGDGWRTQYCHLRRGSIGVTQDQRVAAGDMLGMVGLSGLTEFPHLHLQVTHEGTVVDPFAGQDRQSFCGVGPNPLWRPAVLDRLAYRPAQIYNAGVTDTAPEYAEVQNGQHHRDVLPADAGALVLWADIFSVHSGDKVAFSAVHADGEPAYRFSADVPRNQARRFVYTGKRRTGGDWVPGTYQATVELRRPDDDLGPGVYVHEFDFEIR